MDWLKWEREDKEIGYSFHVVCLYYSHDRHDVSRIFLNHCFIVQTGHLKHFGLLHTGYMEMMTVSLKSSDSMYYCCVSMWGFEWERQPHNYKIQTYFISQVTIIFSIEIH